MGRIYNTRCYSCTGLILLNNLPSLPTHALWVAFPGSHRRYCVCSRNAARALVAYISLRQNARHRASLALKMAGHHLMNICCRENLYHTQGTTERTIHEKYSSGQSTVKPPRTFRATFVQLLYNFRESFVQVKSKIWRNDHKMLATFSKASRQGSRISLSLSLYSSPSPPCDLPRLVSHGKHQDDDT